MYDTARNAQALAKLAAMTTEELDKIIAQCDRLDANHAVKDEVKRHLRRATGSGAKLDARVNEASRQLRIAVLAEKARRA
jgi:hypothetical protein